MEKRDVGKYGILVGVFIGLVLMLFILESGITGNVVWDGIERDGEYTLPFRINLSSEMSEEHFSFIDLDNSLILYMRMDDVNGSGDPEDLSSYGNNGVLGNSAEIVSSGYWGDAASFDGDGDYIEVAKSESLDSPGVSERLTVCSWFQVNQHGIDFTGIVGKYDTLSGNPDRSYLLARNSVDNRYGIFLSLDGTTFDANVLTNSVLDTSRWYYLCGVYNGSLVTLYLDGVQQSGTSSLASLHNNTNSSLLIGKFGRADSEFNGSIDEVMIFNRSLSFEEINSLYNASVNEYDYLFSNLSLGIHSLKGYSVNKSGHLNNTELINFSIVESAGSNSSGEFNINFDSSTSSGTYDGSSIYVDLDSNGSTYYSLVDFDSDLVFWMRMDDVDGISDVLDSSSYENHGSLIETAVINSSSGYFGNGVWFDGDSDYINISDSASLDSPGVTNRITMCTWFNVEDHQSGYIGLIGKWKVDERQYLLAKSSTTNKYGIILSPDGQTHTTNGLEAYTNEALNTNQWYHLCGTFNGSTGQIYLDGVKQTASPTSSGIYALGSGDLSVGTFYGSTIYAFDGMIDEVMIFKRDLDGNEINALYNSSANQYFNNFTGLSNGDYSFRGYAVNDSGSKINTASRTVTLSGGEPPSESLILTLNSVTNFENVFDIPHSITTNIDVDSCWFSRDGANNMTMHKTNDTAFWYDDILDAGEYNVNFYCDNGSEISNLSADYVLRKSKIVNDVYYTNSHGLDIHFDFYFNSTSENGRIVIIPDSWSSTKDSYRDSVGGHFLDLGFVSVPLNTRGKGDSEGDRDAFGYECLDIYEAIQYLITDSAYSGYVNDSVFYIWGFSGAGGKAGVCSAKYPDIFSAAFATGGVLNITKWYTTNPSYQASIEDRVGATPTSDPEAFLTRDGAYLGENSQTPIRVTQYTGDASVNYALARNYNESMISYGKEIEYIEVAGGSHAILGLDDSDEWFESYSEVFIPDSGRLKIGGYVGTKNFSIYFNNVSKLGWVDYDISGITKLFNISTLSFEDEANITTKNLIADLEYIVSVGGVETYYTSNSLGEMNFVNNVSNNLIIIIISPAGEYCGDEICNNGETCSTCVNDCGSCPVSPPGGDSGGSGGGGGGGSKVMNNVTSSVDLILSEIGNVIAREGDKKTLSLNVKNFGKVFLNNCKLIIEGGISSWIYSTQIEGIAPGENIDFVFDLNVPEGIDEGENIGNLIVNCDEGSASQELKVIIPKGLEMITLDEVVYENGLLNLSYSFDNSQIIGEEVSVDFWIVDKVGNEIKRIQERFQINREGIIKRNVLMVLDEEFTGVYYIYFALSSNLDEFSKQSIILGDSVTTGNVIFGDSGNKLIGYIIFVILIGGGVFFIIRKHGKHSENSKNKWLLRKHKKKKKK